MTARNWRRSLSPHTAAFAGLYLDLSRAGWTANDIARGYGIHPRDVEMAFDHLELKDLLAKSQRHPVGDLTP